MNELEEFAQGAFEEVLGEMPATAAQDEKVTRVIACTGKVYYELLAHRHALGADHIALVRLEQLYPFPSNAVATELGRYKNLKAVLWCQEEARNQGAWKFVDDYLRDLQPESATLRYAGPAAGASTAPGNKKMHAALQEQVIHSAFA
ncbi:MAG: hypothetical protein ACOH2R_20610 [Pseudomonas sp.]